MGTRDIRVHGFYHGLYPEIKDNGFSYMGSIQSLRVNWSDGGDRYRNRTSERAVDDSLN